MLSLRSFILYFNYMNPKQNKSEPIKTILVIVVGLLVVYLVSKWQWILYVSVSIGALSLMSVYISKKIDYLWMKLAWILSIILPNVLLSLIFFLLLTPIAFASRVLGEKNQLNLKNTEASLFKEVNKTFDKKSFEKPW